MPVAKLSRRLVEKLRQRSHQVRRLFPLLPIIDHRGIQEPSPLSVFPRGERVRRMDVHRQSATPLALKWVHGGTSRQTIAHVIARVKKHNRLFRKGPYILKAPYAYPVGSELIAMAETSCPSVDEIIDHPTRRGELFFESLKKKGVTRSALQEASRLLYARTGLTADNLILVGVRKKKFVFMPYLDIF